jgi:1,4-dihydroxy-2-naphthoate polyprenyltransferase
MVDSAKSGRWTAPLVAYVRLGRFPFLIGGFILYGLGVAIAHYEGFRIDWSVFLWGQFVVTATQLMVHYSNDYFDRDADCANLTPTRWSGGSRVLPEGLLSPSVALVSAAAFGVLALGGTLWLVTNWRPGPLAAPMLLLAIVLAWFYSAPPIRFHSRRIGEVSATLVLSVLTPLVAYYLQAGQLTHVLILAIIPISCLQFNMLVSVAIPDAEGDRYVNKRTLVVVLGRATTARLYLLILGLAYASLPFLVWMGLPLPVGIAFALSLPLGVWLGYLMWNKAWSYPPKWANLALLNIVVLLSAATFEICAFLSLALPRS